MAEAKKLNPGVKATLVGAGANLGLSIVKFIGGIIGNSTAMVADAVHSVSDLLTDAIVLFTHNIGQKPKDEDHPYGHGRAETIGTTAIGFFIIAAGVGLAHEAWDIIQSGSAEIPKALAALTALVSIATNEWLFRYTRSIGEKSNSPALVANAWHHRSDAISSIAALVGIVGAMIGFPMLDPIAAAGVAFMVMKVGYEITLGGFRDLMDTALSEKQTHDIQVVIDDIPGVIKSHDLRTRRIGGEILMDVHIQVDNDLTVTEGHEVAERVRRKLIKVYPNTQDVLVHVDAYDDSQVESIHNISREDVALLVNPILTNMNGAFKKTRLRVHHLNGKNFIELYLRGDPTKTITESETRLEGIKKHLLMSEHIDGVKLFLEIGRDDDH
ncbi:MAG TPA: cation diffusion facilitator family transporter [Nitrospinaceae bacterium]|jgi:cation diffusion facilitator family transporter|nr:cation diffusion facilitator family transporter [Nitrospinaceae bacterium]